MDHVAPGVGEADVTYRLGPARLDVLGHGAHHQFGRLRYDKSPQCTVCRQWWQRRQRNHGGLGFGGHLCHRHRRGHTIGAHQSVNLVLADKFARILDRGVRFGFVVQNDVAHGLTAQGLGDQLERVLVGHTEGRAGSGGTKRDADRDLGLAGADSESADQREYCKA